MGNIDEKIKSLIDNTEIIEDSFEKYGISIISYSVRVDSDDENNPDYDLITHMELSGKSDEERVVNYVFYDKLSLIKPYHYMLLKSITHPKCTNKLIDTICKHTDINLLKYIIKFLSSVEKTQIQKRHYLEKDKFNIQKLDNKFVNNVERFLEIASENPELKMYVAANEYISLKLLKKFAKDKDENIRNIIQKNPNFTNEMLC